MLGKNNKVRDLKANTKLHYKSYKVGKQWVFTGITALTLGAGIFFGGLSTAHADTTPDTDTNSEATADDTNTSTSGNTATLRTVAQASDDAAATDVTPDSTTGGATSAPAATTTEPSGSQAETSTTPADITSGSTTTQSNPATTSSTPDSVDVDAVDATQSTKATTTTGTPNVDTADETPVYKSPQVKSGEVPSVSIQPTDGSTGVTNITSTGTNFTLAFTGSVDDVISVSIDGADTDSPLFSGSTSAKYMTVSNVTRAPSGVTTTQGTSIGTTPSISNKLTVEGSYSQSFDLKLNSTYTQYSTTATAKSVATAQKKIVVKINGATATSYDFAVNYNVVPIRLLQSATYGQFDIYSAAPVTFSLPSFGTSNQQYSGNLSADSFTKINAKTADFSVAMPTGFKLDEPGTQALNTSRGYTVSQDATTGNIIVHYDATTMAVKAESGSYSNKINVIGAFTGYTPDTPVTVTSPNTFTIVTNDGETVSSDSATTNVFTYKTGSTSTAVTNSTYDFTSFSGMPANTDYISLQRATSGNDVLTIDAGISNYYGTAVQGATTNLTIPDGFTTNKAYVNISAALLAANNNQLNYNVTYSDGSTSAGTLTASGNLNLDGNKTVKQITYQLDIPASANFTIKTGVPDKDSNYSAYGYPVTSYYQLPKATLTLGVDSDVTVGNYQLPVTITGTNADGDSVTANGSQTLAIIDSTYVTPGTIYARPQTSTSAGQILTGSANSTGSSVSYAANRQLSNGEVSKSTDPVDMYMNQPIFYIIAPAQTHFKIDTTKILSGLTGSVVTNYTTSTGLDAYKIDLTQATPRNDYTVTGMGISYGDSQPIEKTGVFRTGFSGIVQRMLFDFLIQADPDAVSGSDDVRMYYTTKNQVNDISNGYDTDGVMTGNPDAISIKINNPTYTIKNMSGIFGLPMVQGSNDTGYSATGTTSIYQPLGNNKFAVNIENLNTNDLTNVAELVNLPVVGDALGSEFAVQLTGAATDVPAGVTVLYGTTAQSQQNGTGVQPDATGYVTADSITDWSTVKSILITTPTLTASANLGRVVFGIQDPTQVNDINKTAYFDTGTYADAMKSIVLTKAAATSMTVGGTATLNYAFLLPDGTTVPAPTLTQALVVGTDKISIPSISPTDIPTGYRLTNPSTGQPQPLLTYATTGYKVGDILNSNADYTSIGGTNGLAVIGQVATYDADGDTVLIPLIDTNPQTATVTYIDDTTGTKLKTDTLTGTSLALATLAGTTTAYTTATNITAYKKAGYTLVANGDGTNGKTIQLDDDTTVDQPFEVHLTHSLVTVTPTNNYTPGTNIGTTTVTYPNGIAKTDLNKTVTETITYKYSDNKVAATTSTPASVTFTRSAIVDGVTGELLGYLDPSQVTAYTKDPTSVTLSADNGWVPVTKILAAVKTPTGLPGYTADKAQIDVQTVTPTSENLAFTVTYSPDAQHATIQYLDQDANNTQLAIDTLDGVTGGTNNYKTTYQTQLKTLTDLGYVYVSQTGDALDANQLITFDTSSTTNQLTKVYLKHGTLITTPTNPGTPDQLMPNGKTDWPNEAAVNNLQRTVTETIHYIYKDGTPVATDSLQSVSFERNAAVDAVTGALLGYLTPEQVASYQADPTSVTLSATDGWVVKSGSVDFKAVTSPAAPKAGYTADLTATQAYTVTPTTGSAVLTVTYNPDAQKATVSYVDDDANGAQVHLDTLNGVTAGISDYDKVRTAVEGGLQRLGYIVGDTDLPANNVVTFDDDASVDQPFVVHLSHQTIAVTPDQPQSPDGQIPTTSTNWPAGVDAHDLNRTVTQKIQFVYSTGGKVAADQTKSVTFQRAAIVDKVTGAVLGYLAPNQVATYQADRTAVTLSPDAGWTVSAGDPDFTVTSVPTKTGYTTDYAANVAYTATPTTGNSVLTVVYTPNDQKATVTYVDDDANGAQVHLDTLNGVTDEYNNYSDVRTAIQGGLTRSGYTVVSSDLPANDLILFDNLDDSDQAYTVHLKHQVKAVTPDQPQTPGTKITGTSTDWPADADGRNLNRTVTQTIQYVYSTGGKVAADKTQTVSYQRAVAVDAVTGTTLGYLAPADVAAYESDPTSVTLTTDGGWTVTTGDADFKAQTSPVQTGYKADLAATSPYTATPTTGSSTLTVTYTPTPQQVIVNYVDDDAAGAQVHTDQLTGKTADSHDYSQVRQAIQGGLTALGYTVTTTDLPENNVITFAALADGAPDQTYTVHLKHNLTAVTPDQPQTPGDDALIPGTGTPWPNGVSHNDLNRTVTQTVQYVYADGGKVSANQEQSVSFQRAAIVDNVTGNVLGYLAPTDLAAYQSDPTSVTLSPDNGWTEVAGNADFAALTSPTKAGYTADLATTAAYTATPTTANATLTVTYTANPQQATVTYVDDDADGAQVHQDTLNGTTGAVNDYTQVKAAIEGGLTRQGYIVTGNDLPTGNVVTFDDQPTDQSYTVHLKHGTQVLTPTTPETPGEPMPNGQTNWPTGVSTNDLNRTVTETIQYVYSNGGKVAPDALQTVNFQRAAIVDSVTGNLLGYLTPAQVTAYQTDPTSVSLSADAGWTPETATDFTAVTSPTAKTGYTADLAATTSYSVTPTMGDLHLTVTYTPDAQSTTVTYVDDDANGAQVHQDTVNGVTDGTNDYTPVKQAIESGLTALGYVVVGDDLPANNVIVFGNQPGSTPSYTVHLKHQMQTITPDQPGKPGDPIVTNNPDGPKWPADSDKAGLERVVTETINYVYEKDGSPAAPSVTDTVTFTRTGTVDLTNGQVTYTDWVANNGKTNFSEKPSPVIPSYLASVTEVPAVTGLTPTSADVTETVTYKALGGYTTNLTNVPEITYPNDPTDAGKTTTTVIPYVPGYQPFGPDGQPLQPVDPDDVTKGYLPPATTDPFTDTPITYQPTVTPGGEGGEPTGTPTAETPENSVTPETPASTTPQTPTNGEPTHPVVPENTSTEPVETSSTQPSATTGQSTTTGENATGTVTNATSETPKAEPQATDTKAATAQLPQTDEQSATGLSLLGLSLLGLLGLGKARWRKED